MILAVNAALRLAVPALIVHVTNHVTCTSFPKHSLWDLAYVSLFYTQMYTFTFTLTCDIYTHTFYFIINIGATKHEEKLSKNVIISLKRFPKVLEDIQGILEDVLLLNQVFNNRKVKIGPKIPLFLHRVWSEYLFLLKFIYFISQLNFRLIQTVSRLQNKVSAETSVVLRVSTRSWSLIFKE